MADPAKLPAELRLLAERHRLQLSDPVFALIAWHWQTVQGAEDRLSALSLEIQARVKTLLATADTVAAVGKPVAQLRDAIDAKPIAAVKRLEEELARPVRAAVAALDSAQRILRESVETLERIRGRTTFAAFAVGAVFGGTVCTWLLL